MIKFKNEKDRLDILSALAINMNEEYRATLQYICHRISAQAIDSMLAEAFKSAALDEMSHILFFSDLITKNGGTPEFSNWNINKSSDIKTMLETDIALERAAEKRYSAQIEQMKGYPELVSIIQSVLCDEEEHESVFTGYLDKMP
jgi:bacterioferritin (cytochrome b1)